MATQRLGQGEFSGGVGNYTVAAFLGQYFTSFTLKKIECSKQTLGSLNNSAWDNRIRDCNSFCWYFEFGLMIKRNNRGGLY